MSDVTQLEKLSDAELKLTALSLGLKPHHKANRATILKLIESQPQYAIDAAVSPAITPLAEVKQEKQTEEDVREAIAQYLNIDGFRAKFDEDTVHFSYQGKVECTTLHQPMKPIRLVAEGVARRTLVHRSIRDGNDTILMG